MAIAGSQSSGYDKVSSGSVMEVRIQIPDDVAAQIQSNGGDVSRSVLEAYALEGYKAGRLSAYQVQEILGFETSMEADGFLKSHGVYLDYDEADLEEDIATSRRVSSQYRDK
jgi:Uncharacterised protein family (UPF0175)